MHAVVGDRLESAKGEALPDAIRHAKDYLTGALGAQLNLGHGSGPMDHAWHWR